VIYKLAESEQLEVHFNDGSRSTFNDTWLDAELSAQVSQRTGQVSMITVNIKEEALL
jgi:hypothetical protein